MKKTRVMLVQPRDSADNYLAKRPTLGLGYLAATLEKKGFRVKIIDMRIKRHNSFYLKKAIKNFNPDFLGLSLTCLTLAHANKIMKYTKLKSSAKIIAGGPEVTLLPKKILENKLVDFIITNEADCSMPEFIEKYSKKDKSWKNIPGLGYREGNRLKINPQEVIKDLDSIPFPAWHLFPLKDYNMFIRRIKFPVMSSRGCPFNCMFCDSAKINNNYRVRSAKNVVDEIEFLHNKYKASNFQFMDDNFALYPKRVSQICDEIMKRKLKISWVVGQGFIASKAEYQLFKKMKKAGCVVVYFGVESADEEILKFIRKPAKLEHMKNAIRAAKKAGLVVKTPFISGLPLATYEKERKYIDFFKEMDIDMPKMGTAIPFPTTDLYEWVKKNAKPTCNLEDVHTMISKTRGSLDTKIFYPAYETKDFTKEERMRILQEFQNESERWVLRKMMEKYVGKTFSIWLSEIVFRLSRKRFIRKIGVRILDFSNKF